MIPEEWVKFHKTEFLLFGVRSEELSRDELLAAIGWLNSQLESERQNRNKCADIQKLVKKYQESATNEY
jgi:hypothetical protein